MPIHTPRTQAEFERQHARLAELERDIAAAPTWGAYVGAMHEEAQALRRSLGVVPPPDPAPTTRPSDAPRTAPAPLTLRAALRLAASDVATLDLAHWPAPLRALHTELCLLRDLRSRLGDGRALGYCVVCDVHRDGGSHAPDCPLALLNIQGDPQ